MDFQLSSMVPYETATLFSTKEPAGFSLKSDLNCTSYRRGNKVFVLYGGYEGIPENLLLNVIGWILLLLLFAILRKRAWNYGRIALVQQNSQKWTQLFYRTDDVVGRVVTEQDSVSSWDSSVVVDKGFFSWLLAIFRINNEHILSKCGADAVQYLSFQRHVIVYMLIITVISVVVVLPVNFQGNLQGNEKSFGHTTLSNLSSDSPYLWLHVTLSILFLPLGIYIMRRFSVSLKLEEQDTSVSRTLMITNIPRHMCNRDLVARHFHEAYPEVEVQDIQFAYSIARLMALDREREVAAKAKYYCENYIKDTGLRLDMRPYACGNICVCCDIFGCPTVDALEYYAEDEGNLAAEVETEKAVALQKPLGIVFVTFQTYDMANRVYKDHRKSCKCATNPPTSSLSRDLNPHDWHVRCSPQPDDIYWEHLAVSTKHWYLKAFLIHVSLFMILFFLTTPAIIVNSLDKINLRDHLSRMSPILSEFLPTLLLWTVAALLPVMVSYSDQLLSHWTRSAENYSVMQKTFIFLLFMVVILPSLGLTSVQTFVEWAVHPQNDTTRWNCIFLPDNGAFFVNYVITSAFIGTALEIIRFPELFMYMVRLCLARSPAETASVRKAILWEFQFGVQYAWMLIIFAVSIMYSITCPLITPFSLVYMILKHLVDRYNIYFAYGPSKISKQIHATAINFVIVSIILLQLSLFFFSILRQGWKDVNYITIYSLTGICLTLAFFIAQVFFHWFKGFSPISYCRFTHADVPSQSSVNLEEKQFIPSVLKLIPNRTTESKDIGVYATSLSPGRNYGTQGEGPLSPEDLMPVYMGDQTQLEPESEQQSLYQNYSTSSRQNMSL